MSVLKWLVIFFAILNFGFMSIDGIRGLIVGEYVKPKSGKYAGQLGPWSKIVESIGIKPKSTLMKAIFVSFGFSGLILTYCFAINLEWAWKGLLAVSVCSLWYLVPGTILNILQISLLLIIRLIK